MCTYYHILIGSRDYQLISGCEPGIQCSSPRACGTPVTCNGCDGRGCTCSLEDCMAVAIQNNAAGFAYNTNSAGDWCNMCTATQLLNQWSARQDWGVYRKRERCPDQSLSNIASKEDMEKNGWTFGDLESKPDNFKEQCDDDTWYGYKSGNDGLYDGVSAVFQGFGTATLTFGDCYDGTVGPERIVDVKLDNTIIETANSNETKRKRFNFFKGSKLRIETNSTKTVIKLKSLEISCDEGKN